MGGLPPMLHSRLDEPAITWDSGLNCQVWMGTLLPEWWSNDHSEPSTGWLKGRLLRVPEEFVEIAERNPTCHETMIATLVDSSSLDWSRTQVGIIIGAPGDEELSVRYSDLSIMVSGTVLSLPVSALLFCELL
jgi:hypothetical protein